MCGQGEKRYISGEKRQGRDGRVGAGNVTNSVFVGMNNIIQ